jgi:predicted nucleic acid-binding Zn ribbon protein
MTEPSPEACEVCGAGPLAIVLHPVAVHYKGSGFYSTDYGKGAKKKDAAAATSSSGGGSSSSSSDGGSSSSGSSESSSSSSPPSKAAEG